MSARGTVAGSRRLALFIAVVLVAALVKIFVLDGGGGRTVVAEFEGSPGLYVGDEVRVIGVKVGKVIAIEDAGDHVEIRLELPDDVDLPADVRAAIVAPTLVSGRYVELAPAYRDGPRLVGDRIARDRTALPVEWDDVKSELTQLATALGPRGEAPGALAEVVTAAHASLDGVAGDLRTTLNGLADATEALADGRGDLFATVRNLRTVVATLRAGDAQVRQFTTQLAGASDVLADNRVGLTRAVRLLGTALDDLRLLVRDNKGQVTATADELRRLTTTLAGRTADLATVLHVLPTAFANFYNVIDPRYSSVTGALSVANVQDLAQLACGAVVSTGQPVIKCKEALRPLLRLLGIYGLPLPGNPATPEPGAGTASRPRTAVPDRADASAPADSLLGLLLPGVLR